MALHPAAQQMIRKVEELSGRPVHVVEDADLKVMAGNAKWIKFGKFAEKSSNLA